MDADELRLEQAKFEYEKSQDARKARQDLLTRFAVLIPLVVAAIGLFGTWWTSKDEAAARREEAARQLQVQQLDSEANFALKAADLVLAGDPGPATVRNRLTVLTEMYGGTYLPTDLVDRFTGPNVVNWTADEARLQFLTEMSSTFKCPEQHIAAWKILFGEARVVDSGKHEWIAAMVLPPCPAGPASAAP
jgi:hypothetical protein